MPFTRTQSGLSNLALFHGVDFIVFSEGGCESYSYGDVINGKFNEKAVDIKFWSGIFSKHNFNKTIEYRALGSKTSLQKICQLIIENKISNVIVVLDSDLDGFLGSRFNSPYILYTQGYSWENDVYHPELVKEQISSFIFTAKLLPKYINILNQAYKNFDRHAHRLLMLEIMFRQNDVRFITDCNGERFINGKSIPRLKLDQILNLIKQKKALLPKPVNMPAIPVKICPIRFCYGKLREALGIALISYICGKLNGIKSLPKDLIVGAMIERYKNRTPHPEDNYYAKIVSNLKAA